MLNCVPTLAQLFPTMFTEKSVVLGRGQSKEVIPLHPLTWLETCPNSRPVETKCIEIEKVDI